ncbi:ribbon-helix-helix domain-containing protein [Thomasclavelia ramosa]|uniref:ribbon-helix-helix domain-containing protein n=1 Tax=Thomasclavelia ramosa TaxID=1547 RepID=UPI000E4B22B6|nr:CopG family transcriptional regulator [Thomasclavelia ramosa]RGX60935.1 ribbon-helix-helix domain-containing protein [Thomasclavelia ramosa]
MSVAGNKKRVFITLDPNILEQLEFLAEKKGVNKSSLISFWISDEYERVKNSEKKDEKK